MERLVGCDEVEGGIEEDFLGIDEFGEGVRHYVVVMFFIDLCKSIKSCMCD